MFVVLPASSTYESILEPILSVVSVSSALTLAGTKLLPSHCNTSPTLGAALVVSTSESASIDLLPNAVSKSL